MKICTSCGTECSDTASFCSSCGSKLESPAPSEPASDTPSRPRSSVFSKMVLLILFALFILYLLVSVVYLSQGMPFSYFSSDLMSILLICGILFIPFIIVHAVSETIHANRPKSTRIVSRLFYSIFVVIGCLFFTLVSQTLDYVPYYSEEIYFAERYMERSKQEVAERFEDDGYTVTGYTVPDKWEYSYRDGEYRVIFVTEAERGIQGRQKFFCTLTYSFSSKKHFVLTDIKITPLD